ncbi:hypothetical protein ABZV67_37905 [Streptomyces sp. NPDC005065]|uniref:hypothetical protein n=1 Tax=unclassified Streptomyces TaxID=2593676 RepID=UPI0033A51EE8
MTSTTDMQYRYRWQATGHRVLRELLSSSKQAGLPALTWTLATTGALTGEVSGLGATADEQRATITAWARHLGATVTETSRPDGRISLAASFPTHGGERTGVLRAELPDAD